MAWKTLIPFSLPSVLFVILSSVNFHPSVCFSPMPSRLSASCLLGSLRNRSCFFFFFSLSQGPVFYFLLPLSESSQKRLRSNWSTDSVLFYSFFPPLYFFAFPGLFFIATRRYIVNIDFKLGSENTELESNITMPVKRRKISSWRWRRLDFVWVWVCVCVLCLRCTASLRSLDTKSYIVCGYENTVRWSDVT